MVGISAFLHLLKEPSAKAPADLPRSFSVVLDMRFSKEECVLPGVAIGFALVGAGGVFRSMNFDYSIRCNRRLSKRPKVYDQGGTRKFKG